MENTCFIVMECDLSGTTEWPYYKCRDQLTHLSADQTKHLKDLGCVSIPSERCRSVIFAQIPKNPHTTHTTHTPTPPTRPHHPHAHTTHTPTPHTQPPTHIALHCITLHHIALHCIALHCIAYRLSRNTQHATRNTQHATRNT